MCWWWEIVLLWQTETGRQFDYKAEDFTLERIIEWGFDQYSDKIKDISGAATKELAIENGLAEINVVWELTIFEIVPYKDKGHMKIKYAHYEHSSPTYIHAHILEISVI